MGIRFIPPALHGVADYLGGLALLMTPAVFGIEERDEPAATIPKVLGIAFITQALMTRYQLGLIKVLPFRMHLMMDYLGATLLAASPFLFGFRNKRQSVWMPHLIQGVTYLAISMLTRPDADED